MKETRNERAEIQGREAESVQRSQRGFRGKSKAKQKINQEDGVLVGILCFTLPFFSFLVLLFFFSLTCFVGDYCLLTKVVMLVGNLSRVINAFH